MRDSDGSPCDTCTSSEWSSRDPLSICHSRPMPRVVRCRVHGDSRVETRRRTSSLCSGTFGVSLDTRNVAV